MESYEGRMSAHSDIAESSAIKHYNRIMLQPAFIIIKFL